jgi:hypothetical protein
MQWSCKSVAVSAGSAAKLKFSFDVAPSVTLAPMKILNNLTFTGTPVVEVTSSGALDGGPYPLLTVVGTAPTGIIPVVSGAAGKVLAGRPIRFT